jgi:hypothetical protein
MAAEPTSARTYPLFLENAFAVLITTIVLDLHLGGGSTIHPHLSFAITPKTDNLF